MSGGAKNIVVENCTFIGTDIGLRFKTARGRGGVVENIAINHIYMKDIVAEAILFDMYYMAKDPVVLAGEKREPPKVETLPVNEGTPQFRNFAVNDVVCDGAEKAIFIRGLPEMHIRNIALKNMVLQARKGLDVQEASSIVLENVQLLTQDTDPVMNVHNSDNILLDKIGYNKAQLLLNVTGGKSKNIVLKGTDKTQAATVLKTGYGATAQTAIVQ
jgi:hypothetical protein